MKYNSFINYRKIFLLMFTVIFSLILSVKVEALNIDLNDVSVKEKSDTINVVNPSFSSNKITSTVRFNEVNDYVSFELSFKNNENERYKIESVKDNNTNTNLRIEYGYDTGFISSNDIIKVIVKLTYKNKLSNVEKINLEDLEIIITFINENEEKTSLNINPKTGDNVLNYISLLLLSVIGIALLLTKKDIKNKNKIGIALFALSVSLITYTTYAKEKYEVKIYFSDLEIMGEFEDYNVTVDPDNGTSESSIVVTYGQKLGALPPNPSKNGYNFTKWVDGNGNEVTEDTVVTGPIEIIAQYTPVVYEITYTLNGGSAANPAVYTIETNDITLNNPTKEGYVFSGWTGSNGDSLQTRVTITKGSTGNKNYVANFVAGESTPYKVIHKYQNIDLNTYTEEVENLTGVTDSEVTPAVKEKQGFTSPSTSTITIKADGTSSVTYTYTRNNYTFEVTDRTYLDSESTSNGSYPYETVISLKAKERSGYTFKWSDDVTDYEREITLSENTELSLVYTANTNTPYKVIHKKMNLDGSTYAVEETENLTGTTDSEITPAVKSYIGFTSPSAQTVTILGDGSLEVEYLYTRNKYALNVTDRTYVTGTSTANGEYYYGEQIMLSAQNRNGYTFVKWNNDLTNQTVQLTIEEDLTLTPEYSANTNTPYKVVHKKMNLDGSTYAVEETENLTGVTDSEVTPAVKTYTGFTSPSAETVTILGDGSLEVEYLYTRNKYVLNVTDRTYVTSASTANGEYYYGEQITLSAVNRNGYTFVKWSNDLTNQTIQFSLTSDTIIEPVYNANDGVAYKVIHKKEKLNSSGYDEEVENLTGVTDSEVTPAVKSYIGFTSPSAQTVTILGDGSTTVTYIYTRNSYTFSVTDRTYLDSTSTSNGSYPYETVISLKAKERSGYTFKWSDDVTDYEREITLSENTELSLIYSAKTDTPYKVIHKKMNLDGSTYTVEETENLTGVTDNEITPAVKTYTGFTSPRAQTVTILGDGSLEVEYLYERNKYTLNVTDRTYVTSTSTANGEYYYGEQIMLSAQNRNGYTFVKWSSNLLSQTLQITIEEDLTLTPEYTANTNTPYKVIHKKMNLDGSTYTVEETENLTGVTDNEVTPAVKTYTGFTSPSTKTVTILGDGSLEVEYLYTRNKVVLSLEDTNYIEEGDVSGEYFYGDSLTLNAKERTHYTFVKWSNNETTSQITVDFGTENISLKPIYERKTYTIIFDTDGGENIPNRTINGGDAIGTLPTTEKENKHFVGWYTSSTQGSEITETFIPTESMTIYARFSDIKILCKNAKELHTDTCVANGSVGCKASGYQDGDTIIFGSLATSENYEAGNAFDCDVNGDGTYDSDTERFYYLRTLNDKAVLISHTNFEGEDGQAIVNIFGYDTALTKLPTTTQWSNVDETFDDKAARFASLADISAACGSNNTTAGSLDACVFLFENSKWVDVNKGRTAMWLQKENTTLYRINTTERMIQRPAATSNDFVRPTIEVALESILYEQGESFVVTFDSRGGSEVAQITVQKGAAIGTLPVPTNGIATFEGWYTDTTYATKITESTIINSNVTYYAKWNMDSVAAEIDGTYFETLAKAIESIKNSNNTTIKLLKDQSGTFTIVSGRNIVLDLNGKTLSTTSSNVIKNSGTLRITNGNISSTATSGAVDNNATGNLTLDNISVINTSTRQAVYNNGGILTINENTYLEASSSERATLHNLANGTIYLNSGTVIANKQQALKNESGNVIIGVEDEMHNQADPVLQGKTYAITTSGDISIYDGILKGETNAIDNKNKIIATEDGAVEVNGTENDFKTLTYSLTSDKYKVTFDPNGGTVNPTFVKIDIGSAVGTLPTPTNGVYTFVGWFTQKTGGEEVTAETVPSSSTTYYARWEYVASNEIVNFDMTNDVMKVYYNNISTWKTNENTFQSNMDANFANFNCSECTGPNYQECPAPASGTTLCDQPKGYSTGVDSIKVYKSNESTKEKGAEVSYTTVDDGTIYNMIPGETYYWESTSDSNVYGLVKASAKRRTISSNVRNVRDLGGLKVDTDGNGTTDGTIKYGMIFRGAKLSSSSSDASELSKLGITKEVDLRGSSSDAKLSNYIGRSITNYLIYPDTYASNYATFRKALKDTMQDVVDGEKIYFHCAIGTDRTGTMAYFLEGLLGVSEEDRIQDYELSYFYGLLNRHRFHDNLSGSSINPRFTTMANTYKTNESIYNYFIDGAANETEKAADIQLVTNFRNVMINNN